MNVSDALSASHRPAGQGRMGKKGVGEQDSRDNYVVSEDPRMSDQQPRVQCHACDSKWFGEIAAHGLSVLGRCPRCDGQLRFSAETASAAEGSAEVAPERAELQPWQVMGAPTSWSGQ
jgi:hypothetical protein